MAWDDEMLSLIGLCGADGVGPATVARLQQEARRRGVPLGWLAARPAGQLVAEMGLSRRAARAVADARDPLQAGRALLGRLAHCQGDVLALGREGYPARLAAELGEGAPAVLFVAGDLSALARRCFAVVGSRRPSRVAEEAAGALAGRLAAAGCTVVSGGARGVDMAAHAAAAGAGRTVAVPAVGLLRFRRRGLGAAGLARRGWTLLGQFPPGSGWRNGHALTRNRTVVALSEAVVAFEPRDAGGTWYTSLWTLKMRKPLFVATAARRGAARRGAERLVRLGAVALDLRCMPDADALAALAADYRPPPGADQLPLFAEESADGGA